MIDAFSFFLGFILTLIVLIILGFIDRALLIPSVKSDHPITPHKEIKVDANGDSTITYIYKLDE